MFAALKVHPKRIVALAILFNILLHLPFLNLPPCSIHVWRQCNTLAVARNFYEERGTVFEPRVDKRNDSGGITGMQFPAYEWVLAKIYQVAGDHNWVHRCYSLVISSIGILFVFGFFHRLTTNTFVSACTAWSYCWSPELFYHGINALPDILALTSGIASLYYFLRWITERKNTYFALSMFCILLAGLVKMQYLLFGAFMLGLLLSKLRANKSAFSKNELLLLLFSAAAVISTVLWWYNYANMQIEKSNLRDFVLNIRPEKNITTAFSILKKNIISDWPELLLNYANTVLAILGCSLFFLQKKWKSGYFLPFLFATLLYFIYHLLELHQMIVHQYYMLPSLLLFSGVIFIGLHYLAEKKQFVLLTVLLIAQPVLAGIRILPARWMKEDKGIPVEFLEQKSLTDLKNCISAKDLVLMGPDESGCIFFYFLHKKGFGYETTGDLARTLPNGKLYIEDAIDRGAKYLYIKDEHPEADVTLRNYISEKVTQDGQFAVYRLVPGK